MNNIDIIEKIIISKNIKTIKDVFAEFQMKLDEVIISLILLGHSPEEVSENFIQLIKVNDDKLFEVLEKYLDLPYDYKKYLIPYTVKTAFFLLINFTDKISRSKEIISEIKQNDDYLEQVKKENIFDKDIIALTSNVDFKSNISVEDQILNNLLHKNNISFIEPEYLSLFHHFELLTFCSFSEKTRDSLQNFINQYYQDLIYPDVIKLNLILKKSKIIIDINLELLKAKLNFPLDNIDFNKLIQDFLKEFKKDASSDFIENAVKAGLTSTWGLSSLDLGVKALKNLIISFNSQTSELNDEKIIEDFQKFKMSSEDDVKQWFINQLKEIVLDLGKNINFDLSTIDNKFYENKYQDFISKYIYFYLTNSSSFQSKEGLIKNKTHTEIFSDIYDFVQITNGNLKF